MPRSGYIKASGSITGSSGSCTGNAATATRWATGRTISLTGDVTGTSAAFDGSAALSFAVTLVNSGVTAGTYLKVTVDAKGRVTTGTSLASADITGALGYTPANKAGEKVFRAFELAIAIKNAAVKIGLIGAQTAAKVTSDTAMAASDTARAGVEQGNSIITTGIKAIEAVVNAIRSLPFPLNIAAGAVTAGVIASLGLAISGAFGGSAKPPVTNDGTGTVYRHSRPHA